MDDTDYTAQDPANSAVNESSDPARATDGVGDDAVGPGAGSGHGHLPWLGHRTPRGRVARQVARRHRRERIAGILIAVLGVAVLVVAFVALRQPKTTGTAAGSDTRVVSPAPSPSGGTAGHSSSKTSSSSSSHHLAVAKPLIVLNQTTTPDLGQQAASRFHAGGWPISSVQENYQNDVITTTAYYDPATAGAEHAAQALVRQYPTIHRVAARFTQLPAGPVVVVLTSDYSSG